MLFSNYAMQKQMVVPDDGRRIEALEANKINKIVNVKPKPIEAIDLSSNTEKVKKKPEKPLNNMEKEVEVGGGALRKKAPTLTPVLTARSKAQIVDIHATDVDNKLERQIDTVFSYTRLCKAFVSACTHILGLEGTPEGVEDQGKLTRVAVFPIGINSDRFVRALKIPEVQEHMKELKERFAGRKIKSLQDKFMRLWDTLMGDSKLLLLFPYTIWFVFFIFLFFYIYIY
ncbi:uncharacterized protein LOC115695316 isoform X2 [Cannabis sativa]|uniref:uncharacterized protein LOC115695316 isoform X2 n=1 Tax=Cannabis sativa TaxID=3483 RepID=UPI0029CA1BC2|nr:uncharacterized protein LOC115695316 isoform X2 [Cannabis sativa]